MRFCLNQEYILSHLLFFSYMYIYHNFEDFSLKNFNQNFLKGKVKKSVFMYAVILDYCFDAVFWYNCLLYGGKIS